MNLRIVVVYSNCLYNINKLNNKEKKRKRKKARKEKINNTYMSDKQRYLRF